MLDDLPATIDPKTKAMPAERFSAAGEVREVCDQLISADRPRAQQRARTQGIIDGNRPYQQANMTANAQGWRANVNYREAEGTVQANRTPYYDLVTEVSPCVEIDVDYGSSSQMEEWGKKIARRLHDLIFGWDSFDWHIQLQQSEMLVHGWGTHLWLGSKYDWRCKTKTMRNVLFPSGATSELEDLEMFMVRDPQKAHQLWGSIKNEKAAAAVGWRPSAVKEALARASKDGANGKAKTSEEVQASLKRGDLGHAYARSKEVILNHLFVREFEGGKDDLGGITHYIIEEGQDEYLYRKRHRFDEFGNVLAFFPYDIGSEGTIHSIRGLGTRIFPFMELSNRLKNHMVDSVLVSTGVLLSQKGSVDPAKLQLTSVGPMKLLPAGVEAANFKFMGLEQGPLALSRELQQTMSENTKTMRQSVSDGARQERTAFEVSVNQADTAKLLKSAHNMYYRNLGRFYRETARRACDPNVTTAMPGGRAAVRFQEQCMRDGVPRAALSKIVAVRASQSIGAGSASQRMIATQAIMQTLYPGADDISRSNMRRDFAASLVGYAHVDRYAPELNTAGIPTDDDAIAVLENDALLRGGEAIVTMKQNHLRHAGRHLQKAGQLAQMLGQGQADPRQVLAAWQALGPHIAAHMAHLEQDPTQKQAFEGLHGQFVQLSKLADKLAQHVAEMDAKAQEEQANAPQGGGQPAAGPFGDPELDLEWTRLQGELQMKAQKMMGELAIKKAKAQADMHLKDLKTAADVRRKSGDTAQNTLPYAREGGNTGAQ